MKLLAVRLSALGDVMHAIPAVTSLRSSFDVSWVVEAPYAELVETVAGVRAVPVRLKKFSVGEVRNAWRTVRSFDIAVDFQGLLKSAAIARASGASDRYGFAREAVREKPAALFYNHKIKVDQTRHVVDWNLQLAQAVTGNRQPETGNWSDYAQDARNRLHGLRNKIVLLPGAGREEKLWPVDRFRDLVARYGNRAVVVSGPGERDLATAIGGLIAPETNLRELAFLLKHADIVIGADTGPLHLADALGTKVVGLYGPTDPARNGPYGQLHHTIRRSKTMDSITAAEVIKRIEEELAE
ncbi:MAG TPA: glycosyltransferase family 9 protein [Thermoanaerobaculia bacterium]